MILNHYFSEITGIGINTINHPLPPNSTEAMKKNTNFFIQGFLISLWVTVGIMLAFGAFVALPVKERCSGVKTLQRCSGAPVWLSWMAQYTWDLLGGQKSHCRTLPYLIFKVFQPIKIADFNI